MMSLLSIPNAASLLKQSSTGCLYLVMASLFYAGCTGYLWRAAHMASARALLARARQLYDDPALPFARTAAQHAWQGGFESGAEWMRLVLSHLRGQPLSTVGYSFQ